MFVRYPKYDDTNIKWLGEKPKHWKLIRSDAIIKTNTEKINPKDLKNEKVFHYSIPNVQEVGDGKIEKGEDIQSDKIVILEKQVIVSKLNPRKATVCIAQPHNKITVCSGEFIPLVPKAIYVKFLYYFVRSTEYRQRLDAKVQSVTKSHQRADPTDVFKFYLGLPTQIEQQKIAQFLDHETAKIHRLIEKQDKLLGLLDEKRQAIISRAVTKGLDPSVPMKDSGIPWLGQIPEHWKCKRLKFKASIGPSKQTLPKLNENSKVTFLPMESIGTYGSIDLSKKRPLVDVKDGFTPMREGDVVIAKITPCFENGKAALVQNLENGIAFGTTELIVFRPGKEIDNKFLYHLLSNEIIRDIGEVEMYGAAGQQRVPESFFKDNHFGFPPIKEQKEISAHIDQKTAKIDHLISKRQRLRELLEERKQALISAAVTGQIDVRDWIPPDTEEANAPEVAHG